MTCSELKKLKMKHSGPIKIGIESNILTAVMTGVGQYCFHLVKALMDNNNDVLFSGFTEWQWRTLTVADLGRFERMQSDSDDQARVSQQLRKAKRVLRVKLSQSSVFRPIYRRAQAWQFGRGIEGIDIFHAFKYVPLTDLEIPTLPVVYDLSFVRYPESHPKTRLRELAQLPKVIHRAPIVQTISHFSKNEIVDVFGCAPEKIIVVPPAAREIFRPLGPKATKEGLTSLKLNLARFFLAVGTLEPRKNLRTLIAAYAQLDRAERSRTPLVVVGYGGWGNLKLPPQTESLIREGSLRFLGLISDNELRDLYEGAIALLYPSVYEGFGMPVVEAFACGTRVAHSKGTAMDEVTGGEAQLIAAEDVCGWLEVMKLLLDEPEDDTARAKRIVRAKTYSWKDSAMIVRGAYNQLT
jgi:glycosyltransferase involved in cell wall biosynthesis